MMTNIGGTGGTGTGHSAFCTTGIGTFWLLTPVLAFPEKLTSLNW